MLTYFKAEHNIRILKNSSQILMFHHIYYTHLFYLRLTQPYAHKHADRSSTKSKQLLNLAKKRPLVAVAKYNFPKFYGICILMTTLYI